MYFGFGDMEVINDLMRISFLGKNDWAKLMIEVE